MKILFATDGSTHAQAGIEMLNLLPLPREAPLTVLSVAYAERPWTTGTPGWLIDAEKLYEEAKAAEMEAVQHRVEVAAEQLRRAGWQVEEVVRFGHPVEQILQVAEEVDADLLVLGSRGLGRFQGWLLGSVSQAAVGAAQCSVLVVRRAPGAEASQPFRILFATDGSDDAAAACEALQQFHFRENSELAVLTVVRDHIPITQESLQAARELVGSVSEDLRSSFGQVTTFVREGAPADQIIETAQTWNADLIVVGSKGLSGIKALVIGSVSQKVATYAPCSVLVVKKKE